MNKKQLSEYQQARRKVRSIRGFYVHLCVYIFVNLVIIYVNTWSLGWKALSYAATYSTAFFWGIGLCAHWAAVFGSDFFFGKKWEEKKIREFMEKEKREHWE